MRILEAVPVAGAAGVAELEGPEGQRLLAPPSVAVAGALMGPATSAVAAGMPANALAAGGPVDSIEQMIDISQVEGRVRASSIKKIGEIVDKHPEEAVNIIRNWMYRET
ncbi:MAG TPA: hypothetical protein VGO34_00435 [Alphaproteobacteria bacterium]